ncbi:GNAT family N-acetyltransferase [Flavihumibacter sp. ZG627]|uniref:GNAT family N-acetyltransferase n=1 Tax=Flavihumibacter sp. ZG627 TaxID=1463156 RepID=UPI0006949BD6|nr:GNAT family N-acetyltransferase [Flavihumibacter sp. ZG627]
MITIRQATIDDIPTVAYLFDKYRQWYKQAADLEGAIDFLQSRTENGESVILVAMEEGEQIGFTQLYPIFSSVSLSKAWLLNDLFVIESQRGKGVATKLLEAAKNVGINTESKWLMLQTSDWNSEAQALYEKNGWVRESDYFYRFDLPQKPQ